jgi:crossover junction endodeoxyribonuclease RuvC
MPGQGVTSMFNFGEKFGFVQALAFSTNAAVSFMRPQEWKKLVGIPAGSEKGASRLRASQLFPQHSDNWARVRDDGRAEAVLIAYAGMLKLRGGK